MPCHAVSHKHACKQHTLQRRIPDATLDGKREVGRAVPQGWQHPLLAGETRWRTQPSQQGVLKARKVKGKAA